MLNIVICDDDSLLLQKVSSKVKQFMNQKNYSFTMNTFQTGGELIHSCAMQEEGYQLAFLDINIGENEDGFKVAEKLRQLYQDKIVIIFFTAHDEYVFQCFEYSPFAFIRKSKLDEELFPILDRAVVQLNKYKNEIQIFKTVQGERKIDLSKVMYFERLGRKTIIVTESESYETNYQLIQIEEMIGESEFIMIHRSIIVNMKYIFSIEKDCVVLENKEQLPLSRHRIKEVKKAFNLYL
ncbi:MAG: LytR/AlgR family response regulator transcription factor [Cellulosilyticaceae bacterium]